jgi:simple sugar transport system permease protein
VVGITAALLALLVATLSTILVVTGFPIAAALAALWDGAFGSWYALSSATFVRSTPLILTGLAVALAFRAGIWNVGAEGQLLAGASCVVALGMFGPKLPPILGISALLLAGAAAGALWAAIAAVLKTRFHALEVISTIMLNFLAAHLVGYLVRGPLQEPQRIYPQSPDIAEAFRIAPIITGTRLTWAFPIALVLAAVLWFVLTKSAWGYRARAIGANPLAAEVAGQIDVRGMIVRIFLASGALAGAAGAFEVLSVTGALYENLSPGYGYTAIAVALLARLNPLLVVPSAVLFGALEAGAASMQRDAGVPSVVVWVVEGVLLLAILVVDRVRSVHRFSVLKAADKPVPA